MNVNISEINSQRRIKMFTNTKKLRSLILLSVYIFLSSIIYLSTIYTTRPIVSVGKTWYVVNEFTYSSITLHLPRYYNENEKFNEGAIIFAVHFQFPFKYAVQAFGCNFNWVLKPDDYYTTSTLYLYESDFDFCRIILP